MRKFKLFLFVLGVFFLLGFSSNKTVNASSFEKAQVNVTVLLGNSQSEVGNYSQEHNVGSTFSYTPVDQPDYTFLYWVVNGALRQDLPLDHTFTIQSKMNLIAIFKPTGTTHPIIVIDTNGRLLSHQYLANGATPDTPDIPLSKPWSNLEGFVEIGEYEEENPTVYENLPIVDGPKVYVAKYELASDAPSYSVKLDGTPVGESNFKVGDVVELSNTDPDFKYYIDEDTGAILSFDKDYAFTMLNGARNIKSITEGDEINSEPLVSIHHDPNLRTGYQSFLGHFDLPLGYEVIEFGLELTEGGVVKRQPATSLNEETNEFLFSIPNTASYQDVKVYLIAQYGYDAPVTVYNKSRYELNFKAIAPEGSPIDHLYIDGSLVEDTTWQAALVGGEGYKVTKTVIAEPYSILGYNYYATSNLYKEKQEDRVTDAEERIVPFGRHRVIHLNDTVIAWPVVDMTYTVNFSVSNVPSNAGDTIYVVGNFNGWDVSTAVALVKDADGIYRGTVNVSNLKDTGYDHSASNGRRMEYKFLGTNANGAWEARGTNREYVLGFETTFDINVSDIQSFAAVKHEIIYLQFDNDWNMPGNSINMDVQYSVNDVNTEFKLMSIVVGDDKDHYFYIALFDDLNKSVGWVNFRETAKQDNTVGWFEHKPETPVHVVKHWYPNHEHRYEATVITIVYP